MKSLYCTLLFLPLIACQKNKHEPSPEDYGLPGNEQIVQATDTVITLPNIPYRLTLMPSTRETVMHNDAATSDLSLGYFNVLSVDGRDQMWYFTYADWSHYDNSNYTYNGKAFSTRYAWSEDGGASWSRNIEYRQTNDVFTDESVGTCEQCVFYDEELQCYRMIYSKMVSPKTWATYLAESKDGVNWTDVYQIFGESYDSQYGVVQRNGQYVLYMRQWILDRSIRTIGTATITKQGKIVKRPEVVGVSLSPDFPHIYNNAVTELDAQGSMVFFPTFFNSNSQEAIISYASASSAYNIQFSYIDITSFLLEEGGHHGTWICVTPGLVPVPAEEGCFWMYYVRSNLHHHMVLTEYVKTFYCRVKVKVDRV